MNVPPSSCQDILIVDDDKTERETIRRYLTSPADGQTFAFHEAETGGEGLRMLQERSFDCVFLDYLLPDIDGIALLKKIYDPEKDLASSPVVMLAGQGRESVMLDALRAGAQDYILKENMSHAGLRIAKSKAREMFAAKQARRKAEEELQHMRKMEAVGQLTSGVAHDFNNLLTVIVGNLHLLKRRIRSDNFSKEDAESKMAAIGTAAEKGADLVRRLMVFTRQSALAEEIADVNACVSDTFELLKRTLGVNIETEMVLKADCWPVFLDVVEFGNILINFAVNARDAMPAGGKLTIETDNIVLDESYTLKRPDIPPGPYVVIAISDTGAGMDAKTRQRIFEPFFTTKPAGEGTGLGMSMAWGFVRQCGGHIHVYSEEGHGTVFRVYLPRAAEDGNAAEAPEARPLPGGRETILVAEDDEEVRNIAVGMLEKLGYRTVQAQNGHMALEILKQQHRNIDLVFTDIVMPGGMTGIELVAQMRQVFPAVRALYTSGYTENAIPDYHLGADDELISKPYRREALAEKIRKVLDGKAAKRA